MSASEAASKLRFAMVCSSNVNRSMEAHHVLRKHGLAVESFGTGTHVRLPGLDARSPNVYNFGTPYQEIYDDLKEKDRAHYEGTGLLRMMERNAKVKRAPERWQDALGVSRFNVVLCFQERVFDAAVEDLQNRDPESLSAMHVLNMDVTDTAEEAEKAAKQALMLCQMCEAEEDFEANLPTIIDEFERESGRRLLYSMQLV